MAQNQNPNQNDVFADLGAAGRAGSGGSNKPGGRGTQFDAKPGAGAAIDLTDNFHDIGRTDSVGAASLDTGRTGVTAGVVRLDGNYGAPKPQPWPSEFKTGADDDRQSQDAEQ